MIVDKHFTFATALNFGLALKSLTLHGGGSKAPALSVTVYRGTGSYILYRWLTIITSGFLVAGRAITEDVNISSRG